MPRASSCLAQTQKANGEKPRPKGRAPPGFPLWDCARGVWTDEAGQARPAMSTAERKIGQRRQSRGAAALRRDRHAMYGREFFGLHVRIPWAGWGGDYADSDEYAIGTIVDYVEKPQYAGRHFKVAFDPDLRCSWRASARSTRPSPLRPRGRSRTQTGM